MPNVLTTDRLGKLTTESLSAVAQRSFHSIDAWLDAIDDQTNVRVSHSSGTTGGLSFFPQGRRDSQFWDKGYPRIELLDSAFSDNERIRYQGDFDFLWPTYGFGRSGVLRFGDAFRAMLSASNGRFLPMIDQALSADWLYFTISQNKVGIRQEPTRIFTPYLQQCIDEHEQMLARFPQLHDKFLRMLDREVRGRRVVISGAPLPIYQLAKEALACGFEGLFAPGSLVNTYGGGKGFDIPADMNDVILRFAGDARIVATYAMTELLAGFQACAHDRYHSPPSIISFVLDAGTGELRPRSGSQRGRAAFFDLMAQTTWGGIITGDLVDMSWEPCACGRTTPHMSQDIARCAPRAGLEHAVGAAPVAVMEAGLLAMGWSGH